MGQTKALKNFQGTQEEGFVTRGRDLVLDDERHRALAKNGLVTPLEEKKAQEPENKMKAAPENKAITHDTIRDKRVALSDPFAADKIVEAGGQGKVAIGDPNAAGKLAQAARPLPLAGGATGAQTAPSSSQPALQPARHPSKPRRGGRKS